MLHSDDSFCGNVYNNYDLFGKNDDIDTDVKTVMAHFPASNMNLSPGVAPIRKDLDLAHRINVRFTWGWTKRTLRRNS